MKKAIHLTDIQFSHHKKMPPTLTVPELAFHAGEVTAIMGKSGSGKTTLLRLVAGLIVPQRGTVLVNDLEVSRLSDRKRSAYRRQVCDIVFQDFSLVEALTAGENIAFAARLSGRACNSHIIAEALTQVGLEGMENRQVWELSGGQQQRVAIARALVKDGAVVLADEPTSALDEESTHLVMGALKHFAHVDGKPVIIVTHDPAVAEHADRIVTMRDGTVQDDTGTVAVPCYPDEAIDSGVREMSGRVR